MSLRRSQASMKSFIILGVAGLLLACPVHAQDYFSQLDSTAEAVYGSATADQTSLTVILGTVFGAILGLLGVILLIMVIYAGVLWMTAGGNATQIGKAKTILINAIIGIIVITAAYAITEFVVQSLQIEASEETVTE